MDPIIAVVGAGTMGAGIAQSAILAGFRVRLHDRMAAVVEAAQARIGASLDKAVAAGRLDEQQAGAAKARLLVSSRLEELADCPLVIEAIIEDEAAKMALFGQLSHVLGEDAVIATNTSCLSVSQLSRAVRQPGRFVGLHYFFPAAINPLLEVIAGQDSCADAVERAAAFGRATGKQVVVCADIYGFAVNRFFVPYLNEAVRLMDEGFDPVDIERVARESFGTKAGPFKVMDLTKPEIALHAARTLEKLGPFYRPAPGLIGKAASRDSWNIAETEGQGASDPLIRDRLVGAVLLAVTGLLEQKVASPADVDLGARIGLQWQFQPAAEIVRLGEDGVRRLIEPVARATGQALSPAV